MRVTSLTVLGLILLMLGCAGGEWARVLAEDTPGAYRRFLREHPESPHVTEARERLDYLQVRSSPDPESVERFRKAHPESAYLPELEAALEEPLFESARRQGTAEAFRRFLERFPNGRLAERARSNLAYFEIGGAYAPPERLAAFLEEHPESDYADEARRTLAGLTLRDTTRIQTTGLRIEIDPSTPGADRLATRFGDLAVETYRAAGLRLVPVPPGSPAPSVDAWLTIRHGETAVTTQVSNGEVSRPGLLATTEVTLTRAGEEAPFWSETFTLRTSELNRRAGNSILLSASARSYWERFFVPVATWRTSAARRPTLRLAEEPVAIDVRGTRAAALFPDGSFQVLNLADPSSPQAILDYTRRRDLASLSEIRLLGDHVALFGDDGLEVISLQESQPRVVHALDRNAIGQVRAVERHENELLVGGSRGLLAFTLGADSMQKLLGRAVRDLALDGRRLVVIDEEILYVTEVEQLRQGRAAQFRLGTGFDPQRVRASGRLVVVLSPRGLVSLDISNPAQPVKLSWLRPSETGVVQDVALVGGRIFVLGERGLQVIEPRSGRVLDSVDVATRSRVATAGRFLVTVGSEGLEVVDASPWTARSLPAAPAGGQGASSRSGESPERTTSTVGPRP